MSEIRFTPESTPSGVAGKVIAYVETGEIRLGLVDENDVISLTARIFTGKTEAPDADNDVDEGYLVGDIWVDETGDAAYVCVDNADGDADWKEMAPAGGAGDMLADTYDPQAVEDDAFDCDNHLDGSTNGVYTLAERSKLSGIEASADVTDAANVEDAITGVGADTLTDASLLPFVKAAALVKITWENFKIALGAAVVTLTNKRITKRVYSTTDDATAVIDSDSYDEYYLTAIANATEITVTGTPTEGQTIFIGLKDAGASKGLTWTGITALGVTLPTDTTEGKQHIIGIKYIGAAWRAIAVAVEA